MYADINHWSWDQPSQFSRVSERKWYGWRMTMVSPAKRAGICRCWQPPAWSHQHWRRVAAIGCLYKQKVTTDKKNPVNFRVYWDGDNNQLGKWQHHRCFLIVCICKSRVVFMQPVSFDRKHPCDLWSSAFSSCLLAVVFLFTCDPPVSLVQICLTWRGNACFAKANFKTTLFFMPNLILQLWTSPVSCWLWDILVLS